jgi:two-component system, NtrC family, nitrogen regulation sensor histidine kinase GlnL
MKELAFHTDDKLCIRSWEKDIETFTGQPSSRILGNKYFEVLPRILVNDKDAVSEAIKKRKAIACKDYSLNCLYGCIKADITITPQKARNRKIDSVLVQIVPYSTCAVEKKLHQSQKLIDIGKIASTLAHGVRNPLNAIKGAVVYLREKYHNEETLREFTSIMEDEISRLENFISNFLSSSVLETEDRETDINALLKRIEIFTSLQMYTRSVQCRYEFGDVPPITLNTFHLEQAVLNVINNALEAMQCGGKLTIRTLTAERGAELFVVIAISDTGPGLTSETLDERTFERKENGRGFGLSITYEILKHYGGHIEIDGRKNEGTTISLFIPCRRDAKSS